MHYQVPKLQLWYELYVFFPYFHIGYYGSLIIPTCYVKLGYEIRSTNVHEQMLEMWKKNFEVKTVSQSKVHYTSNVNPCLVWE